MRRDDWTRLIERLRREGEMRRGDLTRLIRLLMEDIALWNSPTLVYQALCEATRPIGYHPNVTSVSGIYYRIRRRNRRK